MRPSLAVVAIAFSTSLATLLTGCPRPTVEPDASFPDVFVPVADAPSSFRDSSLSLRDLAIARVAPDHGPFMGGTTVVLRGTGFTDAARVSFAGRRVQDADHRLIDSRRLQVVIPAGEPGPVDVEVTLGDARAVLEDGFTYDALAVDPPSGSVSGGTRITLLGQATDFQETDRIVVGRMPCTDVAVISPTRLVCRTPAGSVGTVDVQVEHADGSRTAAIGGFTYYEASDPYSGGLGGGPIRGSINVSVVDAYLGLPVPTATVVVGNEPATALRGLTNSLGQVTLSADGLVGPVTIHVAKHCFETTTFVSFDARDVTVFLTPWIDLGCIDISDLPGGGNPGRGRNNALVEGELAWSGTAEFEINPWENIPMPREGWRRAAFVFTTQAAANRPNPDPNGDGAQSRVLERIVPGSRYGYPFRIIARPGGLAVVALAGLENVSQGRFVPYVMGVARSVLTSPGETTSGVILRMDIPLDHRVEVLLGERPRAIAAGPDQFRVQTVLDLGGEGVLIRSSVRDLDLLRRADASEVFRFGAQPALQGPLRDARYQVSAAWVTGAADDAPLTVTRRVGITAVDEVVELGPFLGIPDPTAPRTGEFLPAERVLRWRPSGTRLPADFHWVMLVGSDGNPAWRAFVPGDLFEVPLPDLSILPGVDDLATGEVRASIVSLRVPGSRWNEFRYQSLTASNWTENAQTNFRFLR